MFGRKKQSDTCQFCDRPAVRDEKVCACGQATGNMSFDERRQYEVEQWRRYRDAATG